MLLEPKQPLPVALRMGVAALVTTFLLTLLGCASDPVLPTALPESGPTRACMGIDGPFPIVGTPWNATSPVSALAGNRVVPVRWPSGFTATFTPELVIRSMRGEAIAKQGDALPSGSWGGLFVCGTTKGVDIFASRS